MSAFQGFGMVNQAGQMMREGVAGTQQLLASQYRMHMDEYNRQYERLADVRRRVFDPTMKKMVGQIYDVSLGNVLTTAIEKQEIERNTTLGLMKMDSQDVLRERSLKPSKEFGGIMTLGGQAADAAADPKSAPAIGEPGSPYAGPPASEAEQAEGAKSDEQADKKRDIRHVGKGSRMVHYERPKDAPADWEPPDQTWDIWAEFDEEGNEIPGTRGNVSPSDDQWNRQRLKEMSQNPPGVNRTPQSPQAGGAMQGGQPSGQPSGVPTLTKEQQQQMAVAAVRSGGMAPQPVPAAASGGGGSGQLNFGLAQSGIEIIYDQYTGQPSLYKPATGQTLPMTHEGLDGIYKAMRANAILEEAESDLAFNTSVRQRLSREKQLKYLSERALGETALGLARERGLPQEAFERLLPFAHLLSPSDIERLEQDHTELDAMLFEKREKAFMNRRSEIDDEIKLATGEIQMLTSIMKAEMEAARGIVSTGGGRDDYVVGGGQQGNVSIIDTTALDRANSYRNQINTLTQHKKYLIETKKSVYCPFERDSASLKLLVWDVQGNQDPLTSIEKIAASKLTNINDPDMALKEVHRIIGAHPGGVNVAFATMYYPAILEAAEANGWSVNGDDMPDPTAFVERFMHQTEILLNRRQLDGLLRQQREEEMERGASEVLSPGGPSYGPSASGMTPNASRSAPSPSPEQAPSQAAAASATESPEEPLDPETHLSATQMDELATHLARDSKFLRDYLARFAEQYELGPDQMQQYYQLLLQSE